MSKAPFFEKNLELWQLNLILPPHFVNQDFIRWHLTREIAGFLLWCHKHIFCARFWIFDDWYLLLLLYTLPSFVTTTLCLNQKAEVKHHLMSPDPRESLAAGPLGTPQGSWESWKLLPLKPRSPACRETCTWSSRRGDGTLDSNNVEAFM